MAEICRVRPLNIRMTFSGLAFRVGKKWIETQTIKTLTKNLTPAYGSCKINIVRCAIFPHRALRITNWSQLMLTLRNLLSVLSSIAIVSEGLSKYFITNKWGLKAKSLPIREQMRFSKPCNHPLLQDYSKAAN